MGNHRLTHCRKGFTLVEALLAIALTALASSVLLLGIDSSVSLTDDSMNELIAMGLAQQLLDEVLGNPWGGVPTSAPRTNFDQIDDFKNYSSQPPVDACGIPLGEDDGLGARRHPNFQATTGLLGRWTQQVLVYPVNPTNPSVQITQDAASGLKCHAVEVRISRSNPQGQTRELARVKRIVSYVSP